MRPAAAFAYGFALAVLAVPAWAWEDAPRETPPRPHVVYLEVTIAVREMPGAVEVVPYELADSPGLLRLRAALERARVEGPSVSRAVTMEEHDAIFAYLERKWESERDTPPGGMYLVRYVGRDYGVRSVAAH